jgi:hypothetical protein
MSPLGRYGFRSAQTLSRHACDLLVLLAAGLAHLLKGEPRYLALATRLLDARRGQGNVAVKAARKIAVGELTRPLALAGLEGSDDQELLRVPIVGSEG